MACESIVRVADVRDRAEVWRLFLHSHQDNGLFSLAPEKVDVFLNRLLMPELIPDDDTGVRGVIGVIGPVGELEALCGICISDVWYTSEKHLADFLVFVDPANRASDHASALLHWMKLQSDLIGLPLLSGVVSSKRTEAKCRLFKRMFPKVGEYYLYSKQTSH